MSNMSNMPVFPYFSGLKRKSLTGDLVNNLINFQSRGRIPSKHALCDDVTPPSARSICGRDAREPTRMRSSTRREAESKRESTRLAAEIDFREQHDQHSCISLFFRPQTEVAHRRSREQHDQLPIPGPLFAGTRVATFENESKQSFAQDPLSSASSNQRHSLIVRQQTVSRHEQVHFEARRVTIRGARILKASRIAKIACTSPVQR